ncbi:hypothetical protein Tco_0701626 [Tanacetum coccineum]
MSSPNHSTSDIEDAFSSMNILNYTSVSSDYFPASSGSISFNSSENSNIIPSVISPLYNNPYLKNVQSFYAKELPISSPDPITPPAILTPSSILPPSLLFNPRYFFVPEELLPPKKQIHSPSSSSNYIFEIGKCSIKMYLKHHEEHYLDELYLHHIEKMEEGHYQTSKEAVRGKKDKIAFAHYRISDLEQIIERKILCSSPNGIRRHLRICIHKGEHHIRSTSHDQDAIQATSGDSVATDLKAHSANMANIDNTNKNTETSETPIARKGINNHQEEVRT